MAPKSQATGGGRQGAAQMTVAKEQIAWRSQPNAGWCCAVQRANARHSAPTRGKGSDWAFRRRHSGQNLRADLDREQRSARITTLEAANGKCRTMGDPLVPAERSRPGSSWIVIAVVLGVLVMAPPSAQATLDNV